MASFDCGWSLSDRVLVCLGRCRPADSTKDADIVIRRKVGLSTMQLPVPARQSDAITAPSYHWNSSYHICRLADCRNSGSRQGYLKPLNTCLKIYSDLLHRSEGCFPRLQCRSMHDSPDKPWDSRSRLPSSSLDDKTSLSMSRLKLPSLSGTTCVSVRLCSAILISVHSTHCCLHCREDCTTDLGQTDFPIQTNTDIQDVAVLEMRYRPWCVRRIVGLAISADV